jgi:hypothetical protein
VDLGAGVEGELLVRGPQLMRGYRDRPDATAATIDADGWQHTGDLAEITADGVLHITDRVKELIKSGFLGATQGLLTTGPVLVQYWRSFDQLERYARRPDALHLPAWRRFNQRVRDSSDVGIWHETYRVRAGEYEAIYGNMPRVGLAAVAKHVPVGSTSASAARRIGVRPDDTPPVAGY